MKAAFVFGPDDLRLCEVDPPRAGPGDVVLRVGSVGICGSDLAYLATGGVLRPSSKPIPLGHELSGTVVEAGAEVASFKVGDRVIVNPLINLIGNGGGEGAFADHLLVRNVASMPQSLLHLPAALSLDVGALAEPLAVGAHAVNRSRATTGAKVSIFGAGPIGLAALSVLRHRGVDDVVVFDPSAFRRERALQLGAKQVFDPTAVPPAQALLSSHGAVRVHGRDAPSTTHFLKSSGAPILPDIVALARSEATICVVSMMKAPVLLDVQQAVIKELTLTTAMGYPSELPDVIEMLELGSANLEPMISHRFTGQDVLAAFAMAKRPECAAKVIVQYSR